MIDRFRVRGCVLARTNRWRSRVALAIAALSLISGLPGLASAQEAAPPTPLRQRFPGTGNVDRAYPVAADAAGNFVVGGYTTGSLAKPNTGSSDGFVIKYSAAGAVKWRVQPGSADDEVVRGLATDGDGSVVAVGETRGALVGPNQGEADAFVIKYDADGKVRWSRQFGTGGYDAAKGVAIDPGGNTIVAGYRDGNAFVMKFGPGGALKWQRIRPSELLTGVATDAAGNIVVVGSVIAAYTPDGALRWVARPERGAIGVAINAAGRIFVTGSAGYTPAGVSQGYLAAYSKAGIQQWRRLFEKSDSDTENDSVGPMAIASGGNVIIGGMIGGFDEEVGFVASYTPAGIRQWTLTPSNLVFNIGGVATNAAGYLAAAGTILDFDEPDGFYDGYLAKYRVQ